MKYELAKQLKDAGFPQKMKYGDLCIYKEKEYIHTGGGHMEAGGKLEGFFYDKGQTCCNDDDNLHFVNIYINEVVKILTLSELVDACLEQHCVFKLYCWEHGFVIGFQKEEMKDDMEICPTPEEAVAKLWLELNKKND